MQGMDRTKFGAKYLHITPKIHKSKVRNAQEAHECIRPTNFDLTPQLARNYLDDQMFKLYDLIWRKAVASQMSNAEYEETTLEIDSNTAVFKATGNVQLFDGYKNSSLRAKMINCQTYQFKLHSIFHISFMKISKHSHLLA